MLEARHIDRPYADPGCWFIFYEPGILAADVVTRWAETGTLLMFISNKQAAKNAGVEKVCIPALGKISAEQRAEQH